MIAITTVAAVPTDADTLAFFPRLHSFADSVDNSDHLVSRHTRILNTGPEAVFNQRVAMTNTARINFDPHPFRLRLGNISFNKF